MLRSIDRARSLRGGLTRYGRFCSQRLDRFCRPAKRAMRSLSGAITGELATIDPTIRPSHWRAPTLLICWTIELSPSVRLPAATNATMLSRIRDAKRYLAFHGGDLCSVRSVCLEAKNQRDFRLPLWY